MIVQNAEMNRLSQEFSRPSSEIVYLLLIICRKGYFHPFGTSCHKFSYHSVIINCPGWLIFTLGFDFCVGKYNSFNI